MMRPRYAPHTELSLYERAQMSMFTSFDKITYYIFFKSVSAAVCVSARERKKEKENKRETEREREYVCCLPTVRFSIAFIFRI